MDPYTRHANRFFEQYQQLRFEDVHATWLSHLPERAGFALDVGAGSGRDGLALAERGWEVLAVEPAEGLRALGEQATVGRNVQWIADALPELAKVRAHSYRFDLILVSAVWMHLPPAQRERAFRILSELLAPGGVLVVTLRHGPGDGERSFYEVNREELEAWGRNRALVVLHSGRDADRLERKDVWWETLVFKLPDDGTGALPVLRHIIVNDNKASTYKLGLLRTLTRIADGLPGMVLRREEQWVELPLGLVALYWIKLYQPLILRHRLRQAPGTLGYGFAKDSFHALADVSPHDLRVGRTLAPELGRLVLGAIRDAARNIAQMPVRYTKWPSSERPVFEADGASPRLGNRPVRLDRETLAAFGTFRLPTLLWDCFSRYACWLEPAIVNEWVQLMQGYEVRYNDSVYFSALHWEEGRRDTAIVRRIVDERLQARRAVHCIWSDSALRQSHYDVDHCFPWSRWNNNDLWNLMPATSRANAAKAERLPAASLLHTSRQRIIDWWETAFIGGQREEQFFVEAEAALPLIQEPRSLDSVFEGLMQQRLRLKMNQQLAEWMGM